MSWLRRAELITCLVILAIVFVVPLGISFIRGNTPPPPPVLEPTNQRTYAEQQESIAIDHWKLERYKQAADVLLALWSKQSHSAVKGNYDPALARTMTEVACLYRDWARFKESKDVYATLIDYTKKRITVDYNALAREYNGLATTEYAEGNAEKAPDKRRRCFEQAELDYKQAFDISTANSPDQNLFRGLVQANQANVSRELGNESIAQKLEADAQRNGINFFGIERSPL